MKLRSLIVSALLAAIALPVLADDAATKPASLEDQLAAANQQIVDLQMENAALKQQLDAAGSEVEEAKANATKARTQAFEARSDAERMQAEMARAATRPTAAPAVVLQEHDNGSVRAMKRIVRDRIKVGMPFSEASGLLDKPVDTKREGDRDVYTFRRVDQGQQNHGMTTPGARYTLTLKVSDGVVESIDATGR